MTNQTLVSIVIPTYHGSNVICRAVDSALNQTYPNIEVIVVDDNGIGTIEQNNTEKAIQKYQNNPRVKYIAHDNSKHGSAARNTGVAHSSGHYIALLDDDDCFCPNNVEMHVSKLSSLTEDYGASFCSMILMQGKNNTIISTKLEGDLLIPFLKSQLRVGSSLLMVRREVYLELNGFDESFKRHQDWEFLTRLLQKYRIANVDNIGVQKIVMKRNSPKNPKLFEEYRLYYLGKMAPIINTLPDNVQKDIYDIHYSSIAREYFKTMNVFKFMIWIGRTSHPLKSLISILNSFLKRFLQ